MNKSFEVLFLVVATAFIFFIITSNTNTSSHEGSTLLLMKHNRKLKEHYDPSIRQRKGDNNLNLEDYHLIDPVPSSKTTIRHKPIAHGSPLMPYIPKPTSPPPSPASPPKNNGPPGGPY